MWWVRQMRNHWNSVLCQEVPDVQDHWAHFIVQMQKQVPEGNETVFNELLLRVIADSLCRQSDWYCGPVALGKKFVMHQTVRLYHWKWSAFSWFVSGNEAILTMGLPVIYILNQLTIVSLNACCSILYISMVILPNFQRNLMQKHFTSAHSFYYVMKG